MFHFVLFMLYIHLSTIKRTSLLLQVHVEKFKKFLSFERDKKGPITKIYLEIAIVYDLIVRNYVVHIQLLIQILVN